MTDPLDELQRMAEAATPGPWVARQREWGYPDYEGGPVRRLWEVDAAGLHIASSTIYGNEYDARLIAAMRNAMPKLIAVALAAEEAIEDFDCHAEPKQVNQRYVERLRAALDAIHNDTENAK